MSKSKAINKTVEYYMALQYRMEIYPDTEEGGYTIAFPDLPGCLTCVENLEEAFASAEDARREWITATLEDGQTVPEPNNLGNYSGQFKLRIPRSLHRDLAEHSRREGISMNQYCLYLLSMNDAKASMI